MKKVLCTILVMLPSFLPAQTVTILDAWTVDGTYDPSQEDANFAVSAGTDRIVIVCLSGERDGGGPMTVTSVTLGNQALTELFDFTVGTVTAFHNLHYVGYLLETGIQAMDGDSLRVNYGVPPQAPFDSAKIHYASYENVDQTTPIKDSNNNTNTNATSLQLASTITAGDDDKILGFNVLGQHYAPGLSTAGYTEETESIGATNGHASAAYHRTATTSVTENPTFTSATATRMAVSAMVLAAVRLTISGTVYSDEGVTAVGANETARLLVNGTSAGTDLTDASGVYSITATVNSGDSILVYMDNAGLEGVVVTVSDGNNLSGLDIYGDHVITRHDNGGSLTNAVMSAAKGGSGDNDIRYSVTSGALTVSGGDELYVLTGHTFAPGGNVTAPNIKILGTITGGSDTLSTPGNWDATSGAFTPGTSTVQFTNQPSTFTPGTSSYYNVTLSLTDNEQVLTLASNLDVNNNLTITTGDLDVSATNYNITIGGDFSRTGLFTPRNGTVTFDGTNQSIFGSTTFYNLTKSVASVDTLTFQVGTTQTIDGTVTLNGAASNLLSLVSSSPGSQWNFTVNAGATKTISYVDVEDSDALNSDITQRTINPSNSVDGGNNVEWFPTTLGVSITNSTFAFGMVLANTWLSPQSSIVKNSGQSVANMLGQISQFTASGDTWDISATTNGADSVRSQWSTTSNTGPWTDISAYDSDFTIVSSMAVDDTLTLWFRIETPTTTTSLSQYSSTLTVTAQ